MKCSVCNGISFTANRVLWPELISDWQLSQTEAEYIDAQQGTQCDSCSSNIRSISLAKAILAFLDSPPPLKELHKPASTTNFSTLEINEAGSLTPILRELGNYTFGAYPEVDMHSLPYASDSFDLLVHSDTLEHIHNPVHALAECYRVLKPNGGLCFTVPTIVARMTRNRRGLKNSFHGSPELAAEDYVVHTEFGADAWTFILEAGFTNVSIHTFNYPAGIAYLARK